MEAFWKEALKYGGIVTVVMFVVWKIFGDIVAKFSPISAEYAFVLTGIIIVVLFLIAGKAIETKSISDDILKGDTTNITINGNNNAPIIIGDNNHAGKQ